MIAIVPGHSARWQGATSAIGLSEWQINYLLALQIVEAMGAGRALIAVHKAPAGPIELKTGKQVRAAKAAMLARTIRRINAANPAAVVELHWNAVQARTPSGLRMRDHYTSFGICWRGSHRGRDLAADLGEACATTLGTNYLAPVIKGSGYPMLRDVKAPAILLETHNGTNADHHRAFLHAVQSGRLANILAGRLAAIGERPTA